MWWAVPFGLVLGLGIVAAWWWAGKWIQSLPAPGGLIVVILMFALTPWTRRVGHAICNWLVRRPRGETRIDLDG
jgi:putative effector of murein hydrolase LrgA (UPF0299 family)